MNFKLREHQQLAIKRMHNGCILCGGTGSGKSLTALSYYYLQNGGSPYFLEGSSDFEPMEDPCKDLYIITTARKRDTLEWENEMVPFLLSTDTKVNLYSNKVIVDSWNNIQKYKDVKNAFFIFDEQRVVGYGVWTKAFLQIAKYNDWILLSATPGDKWQDYMPVFIANGFYKNKTEFEREHIIYSCFNRSYPQIDRYINEGRLIRLRNKILVDMKYDKPAESHHIDVYVSYDISKYKQITKDRWNIIKNEPIKTASELCYEMRRVVNSDPSRIHAMLDIIDSNSKAIIFYNFDYELELIKSALVKNSIEYAEWNGHKHQPIPESNEWVYLVQYNAGAEGWNCIRTNTIIFYSQNYSYKIMTQSAGRIDRLNTPYKNLYYYHLKSKSGIDLAISKALKAKKKFNETRYAAAYEQKYQVT